MRISLIWYICYFFFSSRRRHTRFDCDWSSDVCSSDLRQVHADLASCGIDADAVPAAQQPDRPADCRLGADVSNNKAVTAAGEAPVGDQGHLRSQASSGDGARRAEHLGHAGRPAWALLADDHHVARAHPTGENRPGGALLALEHARRPHEARSEEHTSELQSQSNLVCRLLLEKKKKDETSSLY